MTKVLLYQTNDRPADQSVSSKMYEIFLNTYKEVNRDDVISELDLFSAYIPNYGNTTIMGVYKRNQGLN